MAGRAGAWVSVGVMRDGCARCCCRARVHQMARSLLVPSGSHGHMRMSPSELNGWVGGDVKAGKVPTRRRGLILTFVARGRDVPVTFMNMADGRDAFSPPLIPLQYGGRSSIHSFIHSLSSRLLYKFINLTLQYHTFHLGVTSISQFRKFASYVQPSSSLFLLFLVDGH